jgi:fluoroquinolone transport system permease protein
MPVFVMGNLSINTFYYMAALLLLEKGEGSLEGLSVTPLRHAEYLTSKLATLVLLAVLETLAIVTFGYGLTFNIVWLIAGVTIFSVIFCLFGFIVVARYDSINTFLFPSIVVTMALSLPAIAYFGVFNGPLIYLHPLMAPMELLTAAFRPISTLRILYGLFYGALWIAITFIWSKRVFYRFIILKQGVKR